MGSFGSSSGFYYWADITILRAGRVNPTAGTLSTNMHSCHLFLCLLWTRFCILEVKINPFTAEHARPSLRKRKIKVTILNSVKPFSPCAFRISVKMHSVESRSIKYTVFHRVCVHFSAQKFYRLAAAKGLMLQSLPLRPLIFFTLPS